MKIVRNRVSQTLSPWVTLNARAIANEGQAEPDWFHSLAQHDYASILAETKSGEIILVRQFRPALERMTLEIPGGLLDDGLDPVESVQRELSEETGYLSLSPPVHLATLDPDPGRLENRLWCFHTKDVEPIQNWEPENGVERVLIPKAEFIELVRSGGFTPALHVAIVGLAIMRGLI